MGSRASLLTFVLSKSTIRQLRFCMRGLGGTDLGRPRLEKGTGPSPKVILRLSDSLKAKLQALADADNRKLAAYIRLVLERHVSARGGK